MPRMSSIAATTSVCRDCCLPVVRLSSIQPGWLAAAMSRHRAMCYPHHEITYRLFLIDTVGDTSQVAVHPAEHDFVIIYGSRRTKLALS